MVGSSQKGPMFCVLFIDRALITSQPCCKCVTVIVFPNCLGQPPVMYVRSLSKYCTYLGTQVCKHSDHWSHLLIFYSNKSRIMYDIVLRYLGS